MTGPATEKLLRLTQPAETATERLVRLTFSDPSNFTQGPDGRLTGSIAEALKGKAAVGSRAAKAGARGAAAANKAMRSPFERMPKAIQSYAQPGDKIYHDGNMTAILHTDGSVAMYDPSHGETIHQAPAGVITPSNLTDAGVTLQGTVAASDLAEGQMATPALQAQLGDLRANGWTTMTTQGLSGMTADEQSGALTALTNIQAKFPAAQPVSIKVGGMPQGGEDAVAVTVPTFNPDGTTSSAITLNTEFFGSGPKGQTTLVDSEKEGAAAGFTSLPASYNFNGQGVAQYTVTHEMGHVMDSFAGPNGPRGASGGNAESWSLNAGAKTVSGADSVSEYGDTNAHEATAESFAVMMMDPGNARGGAADIYNGLTAAYQAKVGK